MTLLEIQGNDWNFVSLIGMVCFFVGIGVGFIAGKFTGKKP